MSANNESLARDKGCDVQDRIRVPIVHDIGDCNKVFPSVDAAVCNSAEL